MQKGWDWRIAGWFVRFLTCSTVKAIFKLLPLIELTRSSISFCIIGFFMSNQTNKALRSHDPRPRRDVFISRMLYLLSFENRCYFCWSFIPIRMIHIVNIEFPTNFAEYKKIDSGLNLLIFWGGIGGWGEKCKVLMYWVVNEGKDEWIDVELAFTKLFGNLIIEKISPGTCINVLYTDLEPAFDVYPSILLYYTRKSKASTTP